MRVTSKNGNKAAYDIPSLIRAKEIGQLPLTSKNNLGSWNHKFKIKCKKHETDVEKFTFLNRTITNSNNLFVNVLFKIKKNWPNLRKIRKMKLISKTHKPF